MEPFNNTLTTPPVRVENGWPLDDEDEDYQQPEEDQYSWRERKLSRPGEGYEYRMRERNDVRGVRYVDGAVPAELKTRLERALDAIAAEPDKDFHPGSEGKVRRTNNVGMSCMRGMWKDVNNAECLLGV